MKRSSLLLSVLLLCGCGTTHVTLKLNNPESFYQNASITVKDKSGFDKSTQDTGDIEPNKTVEQVVDIPDMGKFYVYARKPGQFQSYRYESQTYHVAVGSKSISMLLTLKSQDSFDGQNLDDPKRFEIIDNSFSSLGKSIGATPVSLETTAENVLGGIAVVEYDVKTAKPNLLKLYSPSQIGVEPTSATVISALCPNTLTNNSVELSGNLAARASISYPAIAQFGATFSNQNAYKLTWSMAGYGVVFIPSKTSVSFKQLPDPIKEEIKSFIQNSGNVIRLIQIDSVYVIKNASMSVSEAKKQSTTAKLDASAFFSTEGQYDFSSSQSRTYSYGNIVLNYFGGEIPLAKDLKAPNIFVVDTKVVSQ